MFNRCKAIERATSPERSVSKRAGGELTIFSLLPILCLVTFSQLHAAEPVCETTRYTFSWSLDAQCALTPRGGSSTGTAVILSTSPHPGWLSLQENGLSDYEKDRLAILAMAGEYRTSFEFLEVAGYTPEFERSRPYQSWSTEAIYVVEDRDDFISLQHIIVMFLKTEEGDIQGPFVQKHWRQDWQYEKSRIMEFTGNSSWQHRELSREEYEGRWAQSVFQVDDSPRYEALGRWQHTGSFSSWISNTTWRPLPRRESSIRSDYELLEGTNRHTIVPSGWIHEEENLKRHHDAEGNVSYLAKELGVNRYELIVDFDFSAGDEYWQFSAPFWQQAREVWAQLFEQNERFSLDSSVNGVPLFAPLFGAAAEFAEANEQGDAEQVSLEELEAVKTNINSIISPYLQQE